jgi:hypothetical protein
VKKYASVSKGRRKGLLPCVSKTCLWAHTCNCFWDYSEIYSWVVHSNTGQEQLGLLLCPRLDQPHPGLSPPAVREARVSLRYHSNPCHITEIPKCAFHTGTIFELHLMLCIRERESFCHMLLRRFQMTSLNRTQLLQCNTDDRCWGNQRLMTS